MVGYFTTVQVVDGVLEFRYVYAACTASTEFAELGKEAIQETITSVEKKDASLAEKCRTTVTAFSAGG